MKLDGSGTCKWSTHIGQVLDSSGSRSARQSPNLYEGDLGIVVYPLAMCWLGSRGSSIEEEGTVSNMKRGVPAFA